jgi:hypothetical protein
MGSLLHESQDVSESLEVGSLRGSQWVCLEERHHPFYEQFTPLHGEAEQDLLMIGWPALLNYVPAPEHLLQEFERRPRWLGLGDGEFVLDLPAEPTPGVPDHRDREAPFAVDKADDPLLSTWPFLLIDRTGRIVTAHGNILRRGCDMNEYRRMHGVSSIWPAALFGITSDRGNPLLHAEAITLGPL